ncbi:MAG: CDP-alcohol phosphatidyltransferase family protein [Planctomycetota bacterium]
MDSHVERDRKRHRRARVRRKAVIRGVHTLPSLATLGNAVSGFAAIYVATLTPIDAVDAATITSVDPITAFFMRHTVVAAIYLIALAMIFDALDGRLARIARHTTDFGGQLDSMADMVSFGVAPAIIALKVFRFDGVDLPLVLTRLIFGVSMMYVACAALRLARFNVTNEHGEQHHMSFLGLPSPAAGGAVCGLALMQQDLLQEAVRFAGSGIGSTLHVLSIIATIAVPVVTLGAALLMVSNIRYPHLVNRGLRGRRNLGVLVLAVGIVALLIVQHRYVLGLFALTLMLSGPIVWLHGRWRRAHASAS